MDGCLSATHSSVTLSCSYIEHQPIISRLRRGADATCQVFTENLTQHLHSFPPPIRALGNVVKRSLMTCARISVLPVPTRQEATRFNRIVATRPAGTNPAHPAYVSKKFTFNILLSSKYSASKQSTFYVSIYLLNILLQDNLLYFIKSSTSCSQSAVFPSTVFLCIWISSSFSLSDVDASAFIRLSFMLSPSSSEYTPIGS